MVCLEDDCTVGRKAAGVECRKYDIRFHNTR
jgi:hypothetical protein